MCGDLTDVADTLGSHPVLVRLALVVVVTLLVLFAHSLAGWFDQRNP